MAENVENTSTLHGEPEQHGGSNKGDDDFEGQRDEEIDEQSMFGDEVNANISDGQRDKKNVGDEVNADISDGESSVDTVYKGSGSENAVEKTEVPDEKPTIKKDKDDAPPPRRRNIKPKPETKSKKKQPPCVRDFRGGVWMCLRCHSPIKGDGDDICHGKCQATTLGDCPAMAFKTDEGTVAHDMHPKLADQEWRKQKKEEQAALKAIENSEKERAKYLAAIEKATSAAAEKRIKAREVEEKKKQTALHQEQQRTFLAQASSMRMVHAAYEEAAIKLRGTGKGREIYGASDDTATLQQLKRLQNDIKTHLPELVLERTKNQQAAQESFVPGQLARRGPPEPSSLIRSALGYVKTDAKMAIEAKIQANSAFLANDYRRSDGSSGGFVSPSDSVIDMTGLLLLCLPSFDFFIR